MGGFDVVLIPQLQEDCRYDHGIERYVEGTSWGFILEQNGMLGEYEVNGHYKGSASSSPCLWGDEMRGRTLSLGCSDAHFDKIRSLHESQIVIAGVLLDFTAFSTIYLLHIHKMH